MSRRVSSVGAVAAAIVALCLGRGLIGAPPFQGKVACGTSRTAQEAIFLHQQGMRARQGLAPAAQGVPVAATDHGEIALVEAVPGILHGPNNFDLRRKRIVIDPSGARSSIRVEDLGATVAITKPGGLLDLDDDDFARIELPFDFPYYGIDYDRVYVHSDGNITMVGPEATSTRRNYSRAVGGPPRLAPLFRDLDPSKGGEVRAEAVPAGLTVTWHRVPIFVDEGVGSPQTVQAILSPAGTIEYRYGAVDVTDAVVGIFPGDPARSSEAVDWSAADSASLDSTAILAEVFRKEQELDEWAVAHAFYQTHEDAYDSLVVFGDVGFDASEYSLAHAYSVRNHVRGIGEPNFDYGLFFGSKRRLSQFVNMGGVSDYPERPLSPIPGLPHSSLLTILAHELGHRFLAYARFQDASTGKNSFDLLGRQFAHWSFFFHSQASVLEGNAIRDHGEGASPRFETYAATQTYGPLDQYLMGLRDKSEVPASFLVTDPEGSGRLGNAARSPEVGVRFDGVRKEIRVEDLIASMGERRPDASVSQRHFRQAFVLVHKAGESPKPSSIEKLNTLRSLWPSFVAAQLESRATVAADLVRMLHLSTWPAGGLVKDAAGRGRVTITEPRATDLLVTLRLAGAIATVPATVTVKAGETAAEFDMRGLSAGTATLTAEASEADYDRAVTRLHVRAAVPGLDLVSLHPRQVFGLAGSEPPRPLRYRVIDDNRVPYSGVEVEFFATGSRPGAPPGATTDANGEIAFRWPLAATPQSQLLTARLKADPGEIVLTKASAMAGPPTFESWSVVNAASGEAACPVPRGAFTRPVPCTGRGFAPGSLLKIRGTSLAFEERAANRLLAFGNPELPFSLAGTRVHVGGIAAPLVAVSPGEVTFQVPFDARPGPMQLQLTAPHGRSRVVIVPLGAVQPAIFPDRVSSGSRGAVVGSKPGAGEVLELHCTGLGAVEPQARAGRPGTSQPRQNVLARTEAFVDGRAVNVIHSSLAPFEAGVYVVAVDLPDSLEAGRHTVKLVVGRQESNEVSFESE